MPLPSSRGGEKAGVPLTSAGPLGHLIDTVCQHAEANFEGAELARFAEVWAHRRPQCSGHQLHFDSDNEGIGGAASIRNPLVSAVCYLTEEGLGGPTLVTDQCLGDRGLAQNGWLAFPKCNRLVIFDGQVLHGVIPGRGHSMVERKTPRKQKRVTVMVALWDDIRVRHGDGPGAARPMPLPHSDEQKVPKWAKELLVNTQTDARLATQTISAEKKMLSEPVAVSNVWTSLDDKPLGEEETPHYNLVFQGF